MGREQLAGMEGVVGVEGQFEIRVAKFCFFTCDTRVTPFRTIEHKMNRCTTC